MNNKRHMGNLGALLALSSVANGVPEDVADLSRGMGEKLGGYDFPRRQIVNIGGVDYGPDKAPAVCTMLPYSTSKEERKKRVAQRKAANKGRRR
jgi:hypothetical protein